MRILLPVFTVVTFLLFAAQTPILYKRLISPVQVQQEEAVQVEFARVLLRGESLYPDIRKGGPYLHPSYPPLFPWFQSLLMPLTSNPWAPGRSLAFAGFLGCGFLLGYAAWRRWKGPGWVVLLPGLLWLSPTWASWGTMVRLDTCLHSLNLLSFLILWRTAEPFHPEWKQRKEMPIAVAGLLNAAAILMKPTALTVTLAFGLYAYIRRLKREALIFFVCALLPVLAFLFVTRIRTEGLYWLHTVTWAAAGFRLDPLLHFLGKAFLPEAGWLALGAGYVLWRRNLSLLLKCQLILSTLALVTLSREGAAENYYMEFLWVGLLAVGEGLAVRPGKERGLKGWKAFPSRWAPAAILLAGVVSYSALPAPRVPSAEEIGFKARMLELYRGKGEHFVLDADLPVMAGKRLWYQASGTLVLEREGLWDPEPLVNDIRSRKFSTIELYDIPRQYLVSERVETAIHENYTPFLREYGRVWWVPKGPELLPSG